MRYKTIKFIIEVEFLDTIKSAIQPLLKEDGTVDPDSMKDYQEFLSKVIDVFDKKMVSVLRILTKVVEVKHLITILQYEKMRKPMNLSSV